MTPKTLEEATKSRKITPEKLRQYRNGGDGFILWCEENVRIPIIPIGQTATKWTLMGDLPDTPDPITGRSYKGFWDKQKDVVREALRMENGVFVHRLVIFIWPRGEGKSFLTCLIQLWKFFCWPRQQLVLCANSKDQSKFVHFEIMCNTILNSPSLLAAVGGKKNIQEKEIRMKDAKGNVVSVIRSVSSFSGIISNITGYTFSEIFDMKKPRFFTQIDGSIRNMPNALGVIDSTVSSITHILYRLYQTFVAGKDPTVFVSYRYSLEARMEDYWHPNNNQAQLDSYKSKFPPAEFDQYFKNVWESGTRKQFPEEMVYATQYIGVDGLVGGAGVIQDLLKRKFQAMRRIDEYRHDPATVANQEPFLVEANRRLWPVENVYSLREAGMPKMATRHDLEKLGDIYNTDWAISVGVDRSDPMQTGYSTRTIVTAVAKGLPNSRGKMNETSSTDVPNYIYALLHLKHVATASLEHIKDELLLIQSEYDGIDALCSEKWGMWDIKDWAEEHRIPFEVVNPAYTLQRAVFTELFLIYRSGRFKTPPLAVSGYKLDDILVEEALKLDHDVDKKWYGSPEKKMVGGVQDDAMYSLGYSVYGGRNLTVSDFKERGGPGFFGLFIPNTELIGSYGRR